MTDWNKLKVVDLRAELKNRGLAQTGLKPALVARLAAAENGEGSESEATVQDDTQKLASSATSPDTISPTQPPSDLGSRPLLPQTPSAPLPQTADEAQGPVTDPVDTSAAAERQTRALASEPTNTIDSSREDEHHSELPSVEPLELLADRQKRKRRSQSPPITALDASRKRLRQDSEADIGEGEVVTTSADSAWVEKHNAVDAGEVNAASKEVALDGKGVEPGPTIIDVAKEEIVVEDVPTKQEGASSEILEDSPSRPRDSRFKGLFSTPQVPAMAPNMEQSKSRDSYEEPADIEPDRIVSPAIHPATAALYIRDFMRPLNPTQLQNHLATLATPPGRDVDPDIIVDFYLDPIRTHAFISFTNVSAASRVRSALHGCIWPEERTRKALWVDFIPLEKVQDWINKEESTKPGGRSAAKKWEIVYETDEDRHVTAYLQEVGNVPVAPPSIQQPSMPVLSSSPVAPPKAPTGPRASHNSAPMPVTNMKALDELFKSTESKPRLYWLPVDKSLANKRLDSMDDSTSKAYVRGTGGEINRYTFEDGDILVDRGPEIFPGIRPPGGHRGGPRGGFRRGSGRGGYQGRGGGPERPYDSYRGGRFDNRRDSRDDRRY